MTGSSIGVGNFGDDRFAILHGQKKRSVEHAVGIFFDGHARL